MYSWNGLGHEIPVAAPSLPARAAAEIQGSRGSGPRPVGVDPMIDRRTGFSWRDSFRIYSQPRVLALLFLGFSAGLPFLLVFSTLSAWLASVDVSRATIGFFSWIGVTYSIKVIWSPVVDRLRLGPLTRWLGQRRSWMLVAQLGVALGLWGMAVTDPVTQIEQMALFALLVAFSSATQDVSVDAYRIEAAEDDLQAAMSACYVFGYRLALLVAGAGALYLASLGGWTFSYGLMALLMGVGMLTVLLVPEPRTRRQPALVLDEGVERAMRERYRLPAPAARVTAWLAGAVAGPFADFFRRYGWASLLLLLFISLYRLSDLMMGAMANPFYIDMGYSLEQIANISKVFGFLVTILASALAGVLVLRYGILPILLLGAVLAAATNLLFAWLSLQEATLWRLALVICADNLGAAIASVAFIAYLSSLTSSAYSATQYALFSSLMTLPGKFVGGFGGVWVESLGYAQFFTLTALAGAPAILLLILLMRHPQWSPARAGQSHGGTSAG